MRNNHKLEEGRLPISNIDQIIDNFEEKTRYSVEEVEVTVTIKTNIESERDGEA